MRTRELATLSVDSLTFDGEGVAELDGHEVLCRGAFPGERANVQIEAVSRQKPRAHARLLALSEPHPARREAPCPNHERREGRCAGCALMELDETAQREAKRAMLARIGLSVAHVEAAPSPLGYRFSSKRVAFPSPRGLSLGSYAHKSHAPAPMPDCLVDHPRIAQAFALVERAARELGVQAYDERHATGDLRYVWAKTNGAEVIVTLVTAQRESRVEELAQRLAPLLSGVLHSVQGGPGNSLRGPSSRLLAGRAEIAIALGEATLGEATVHVGALGFVQPNPHVAQAAYGALTRLDEVSGRELAFDLYAGAGITTRLLRAHFREVLASEIHAESARSLGVEAESVEAFLARRRAEARTPDLVVANPPRKGLGAEACDALLALGAPSLHVMSCGPEGLARDLGRLASRYEVARLEAFDTLPQTPHVELVARLRLR